MLGPVRNVSTECSRASGGDDDDEGTTKYRRLAGWTTRGKQQGRRRRKNQAKATRGWARRGPIQNESRHRRERYGLAEQSSWADGASSVGLGSALEGRRRLVAEKDWCSESDGGKRWDGMAAVSTLGAGQLVCNLR